MTATEPVSSVRVLYSPEVAARPDLERAAQAGTALLRKLIDSDEPDVPLAGGPLTAEWKAVSGSPRQLTLTLAQGQSTFRTELSPEDMDSGWGAIHLGLLINQVLGAESRRAIRQVMEHPLSSEAG